MCFILVCDRKVPILGKHTRRITSGSWSNENLLALASDDNTISISNVEGDTIRQTSVRANPQNVQFSEMKGDERSQIGENTVNTSRNKALRNPVPRNTREENTVYISQNTKEYKSSILKYIYEWSTAYVHNMYNSTACSQS